jgi:hypothetical protein
MKLKEITKGARSYGDRYKGILALKEGVFKG